MAGVGPGSIWMPTRAGLRSVTQISQTSQTFSHPPRTYGDLWWCYVPLALSCPQHAFRFTCRDWMHEGSAWSAGCLALPCQGPKAGLRHQRWIRGHSAAFCGVDFALRAQISGCRRPLTLVNKARDYRHGRKALSLYGSGYASSFSDIVHQIPACLRTGKRQVHSDGTACRGRGEIWIRGWEMKLNHKGLSAKATLLAPATTSCQSKRHSPQPLVFEVVYSVFGQRGC